MVGIIWVPAPATLHHELLFIGLWETVVAHIVVMVLRGVDIMVEKASVRFILIIIGVWHETWSILSMHHLLVKCSMVSILIIMHVLLELVELFKFVLMMALLMGLDILVTVVDNMGIMKSLMMHGECLLAKLHQSMRSILVSLSDRLRLIVLLR